MYLCRPRCCHHSIIVVLPTQEESLEWMAGNWAISRSCILGDEVTLPQPANDVEAAGSVALAVHSELEAMHTVNCKVSQCQLISEADISRF